MRQRPILEVSTLLARARADRVPAATTRTALPGSKAAIHDPRWPRIAALLSALRERGRYSVRIVDADCGAGSLLLHAVHQARVLGFTAVEGRGIDGSPALIGRARAAAGRCVDPAIGLEFETADMIAALRAEHDLPVDIVIWHGSRADDRRVAALAALCAAGHVLIGDDGAGLMANVAA